MSWYYDCAFKGSPLATTRLATTSTMSTTAAAPTTTPTPVTTKTQASNALCILESKMIKIHLIWSNKCSLLYAETCIESILITCHLRPLLLRISTFLQAAPSPVWVYTAWLLGIKMNCWLFGSTAAWAWMNGVLQCMQKIVWIVARYTLETLFCSVSCAGTLAFWELLEIWDVMYWIFRRAILWF